VKRGVYFTQEASKTIKIGIPSKGRGQIQTWKLLESCKILPPFSEDLRENPPSLDKSIIVVAERQLDVARDLGFYNLDLGIVGEDMLMEANYPTYSDTINILAKLGFNKCRVSLIGKQGMGLGIEYPRIDAPEPLKIATKLPVIAEKFIKERELNAVVIEREGALETAIKQGIAGAIIDQVATGKTIASFGLKELCTIMESQFVLVSNKQSMEEKGTEIRGIEAMIKGVISARNKNLVAFNIPNKNLESLVREIPACKSPTISPLASKDWSAVSTVVPDESLRKTIAGIKEMGGRDILVTPILVCLDEQRPRQTMGELYKKILERKTNPVIFSRTTRYLKDKEALANKFLGECKEFVDAVKSGKKEGKDGIIWEAADSLYFFLTLAATSSDFAKLNLDSFELRDAEGLELTDECVSDFLGNSKRFVERIQNCLEFVKIRPKGQVVSPGRERAEDRAIAETEIVMSVWLFSWGDLLEKAGVLEKEVEIENGRRDKG